MAQQMSFQSFAAIVLIDFDRFLERCKGIIVNNKAHKMDDLSDHCRRTLLCMAKNLEFEFVYDPQEREQYVNLFLAKYKQTQYSRGHLLLIAALLHDIGIPERLEIVKEGNSFTTTAPNHAIAGAEIVRGILQELNYPDFAIDYVVRIIKYHMSVFRAVEPAELRHIKRFVDNYKNGLDLVLHALSDIEASQIRELDYAVFIRNTGICHRAMRELRLIY